MYLNKKEEKKKVNDVSLVRPVSPSQKAGHDWGTGLSDPPESGRQSTRNISIGGKNINVKTQDMFLPQIDNTRY